MLVKIISDQGREPEFSRVKFVQVLRCGAVKMTHFKDGKEFQRTSVVNGFRSYTTEPESRPVVVAAEPADIELASRVADE